MSRNPLMLAARSQIETPEFKAWFGASAVVDDVGRPLVVYHGTSSNFSEFKKKGVKPNFSSPQKHLGFFFTKSAAYAGQYAGRGFDKDDAVIMPVYLSLQNPKHEPLSLIDDIENKWSAMRAKTYAEKLKLAGHDGIVFSGSCRIGDVDEIVVFSPTQIKSALCNRGTFGPANPDIRFSQKMQDLNSKSQDSSNQSAVPDVAGLQKQLADVEAKYEVLRTQKKQHTPEWDAIAKEAAPIHVKLFELTGDWYGRPKVKLVKPSDDDLLAEYETPGDVPQHVMNWLLKRNQILTSDATDAVRWSRIVGTKKDDRYPSGDMTVYRAVIGDEIRPGDWVTTDLSYAQDHLRRYLGRGGQVLQLDVDGRDVLVSPTGNSEEAIYAPLEFSGAYKPNEAPAAIKRERAR